MKKILLLITSFLSLNAFAQRSIKDSAIHVFALAPSFAYQIPGGDMADRYGNNMNVGGSFSYKSKTNWLFGIEGSFLFGEDIKENSIFDAIDTKDGFILGTSGRYADIRVYERGYHFNFKAGKIIPKWGPNKNSGIVLTAGVGFLQHKIRIENPSEDAPQLSGDYLAGYDRRTNGLAITEFIGYQYLSNRNKINFFAGLEFTQAFTKNRRSFNFDTMSQDNTERFDSLIGIRAGWIFLFYKRKPREYYIN